jgi:two-component system phosphate regulon sensor histidine kinase PhoR
MARVASSVAQQYQENQGLATTVRNLEFILNRVPIAYLQVDQDNHLQWCNPVAQELLGIPCPRNDQSLPNSQGLLNSQGPRLLLELIRSYELDQLIEQTRRTQQAQQAQWTLNLIATDPSNPTPQTFCHLLGHSFPLAGNGVGVFLENRQELVTLAQQRDRWVSDVAHELKTPLTAIGLVAETVHKRVEPKLQIWLDRLLTEVLRLNDMVQDLLELGQLAEDSTQALQWTQVDLVVLIQEAWETLEPLSQTKQIHLDYTGPYQCRIEADRNRLYRVLVNLLDNAIKYSEPAKAIQLSLSSVQVYSPTEPAEPETQVCLNIIDQGHGFPEQTLPHVFERFYRVDPSRQGNSSGLGLAIVQEIITAHQGTVQASNHPKTGGAWLQVSLPMQQSNPVAKP